MSSPYSFAIRITVSNDEGHEDVLFDKAIGSPDQNGLLETEVVSEWQKAANISDERSDDGTHWNVDIECLSVTDVVSGETDWENDIFPQRNEVTYFITNELNAMAPGP